MKCKKCGSELKDGVKFCFNCGEKVDNVDFDMGNNESQQNIIHGKEDFGTKIKIKLVNSWSRMDVFSKIIFVSLILSIVMLFVALISHRIFPLVFSIAQLCGVIFAMLLHKGVIRSTEKWIKYIVLLGIALLGILNLASYSIRLKPRYKISDVQTFKNKEKPNVQPEAEETKSIETIKLPVGYEDCIGKSYSELETILRNAGFGNIHTEKIEDLKAAESERIGSADSVSIGGNLNFKKNQSFAKDEKIVIKYHAYKKNTVKIHINFIPNIIFSKYNVDMHVNEIKKGSLAHGENADYELLLEPGDYTVKFANADSATVKGDIILKVTGNMNISYQITCHDDRIDIGTEYVENLDELDASEIMMPASATEYKHRNYEEVKNEFEQMSLSNIKSEILYDIKIGWTEEGEIEDISINGNKNFNRGDIFAKTDEVVITYHMKEEDDPSKQDEKKKVEESSKSSEETDKESEQTENLTVENCPELLSILSNKADADPSYADFATKYAGKIIEFDGSIDNCIRSEGYTTRFDYLVSVGDFDPNHMIGPYFKFENVSYSQLGTDLESVDVGMNVRIVAEVLQYNPNNSLFFLKPVSIKGR